MINIIFSFIVSQRQRLGDMYGGMSSVLYKIHTLIRQVANKFCPCLIL